VNPAQARIYSPGAPRASPRWRGRPRPRRCAWRASWAARRLPRTIREQADREHAEKLAGFTAELINFPVQKLDFYTNPRLAYLHKQVEGFIGKYANF
jgi:hypothetical protein